MELTALDSSANTVAAAMKVNDVSATADRFAQILNSTKSDDKKTDELKEQAEEFVGFAFYLPLLKQSRDDVFKTDLFHGGFAEDAFGSELDQILSGRLAKRDETGLVDSLVQRYSENIHAWAGVPEIDFNG